MEIKHARDRTALPTMVPLERPHHCWMQRNRQGCYPIRLHRSSGVIAPSACAVCWATDQYESGTSSCGRFCMCRSLPYCAKNTQVCGGCPTNDLHGGAQRSQSEEQVTTQWNQVVLASGSRCT